MTYVLSTESESKIENDRMVALLVESLAATEGDIAALTKWSFGYLGG